MENGQLIEMPKQVPVVFTQGVEKIRDEIQWMQNIRTRVAPILEGINKIRDEIVPCLATITVNKIKTPADAEQVLEMSRSMKRAYKALDELLRKDIDVLFKSHRGMTELLSTLQGPFKRIESTCDSEYKTWYNAEQEKARVEAARIRKEAEDKAKVEAAAQTAKIQDARLAEATKLEAAGFTEEAEAILEKPIEVKVTVEIPKPVAFVAKPNKAHTRDNYKARIKDPKLVMAEIMAGRQSIGIIFRKNEETDSYEPDDTGLQQMTKALKNEMMCPGVEVINETSLVKR